MDGNSFRESESYLQFTLLEEIIYIFVEAAINFKSRHWCNVIYLR